MITKEEQREAQVRLPGSLSESVRAFFTFTSPVLVTIMLAASVALRVWLGEWSWWDLGIAAGIVMVWPFLEWVLHVTTLHAKPRRLGKLTIDLTVARQHRRHHQNPYLLEELFIPHEVIWIAPFFHAALFSTLLPSAPLAMTAIAVTFLFTLHYEWVHFLVHTRYVPKTQLYKRLWISHRLHHFKNEKLWYGVSMLSGDRLLGTSPEPSNVALSPTCRSLGEAV